MCREKCSADPDIYLSGGASSCIRPSFLFILFLPIYLPPPFFSPFLSVPLSLDPKSSDAAHTSASLTSAPYSSGSRDNCLAADPAPNCTAFTRVHTSGRRRNRQSEIPSGGCCSFRSPSVGDRGACPHICQHLSRLPY